MTRLLTALVLMPVLWVIIKMAPPWIFIGVAVLAISVALWECYRILDGRGAQAFRWVGLAASWAIAGSFLAERPLFGPALPLIAGTMLTLTLAMWRRANPAEMLEASLKTVFPLLFVGLALGYLVGLRAMPGEDGKDVLMFLFLCVISADSFAYYTGKTVGRHRMAPRLSPKKTWEGALAGIAGSLIAALVAHLWFYQRLPLEHALILGLALGLAGMLGDLAESLLKRACQVKDSSHLLPGHGGLLDRMDSLLFAGPILYYYYVFFLQGAP